MTTDKDLGTLTGPVLIFGGSYSNLQATQALYQEAQRLAIPPQRVVCSGDTVAYCAEPQATVDLIRDWGIPVVQGNCEQSFGDGAPDCGCGFDEGSACSLLSVDWYRFTRHHLDEASCRWMAALPSTLSFKLAGRRFVVVHGGVCQNNRFIFGSSPVADVEQELAQTDADIVIAGHCGLPFWRRLDHRFWLNSGVVGMPANDASRDGWYLVLSPLKDAIECSWHRLHYDADSASEKMREAGLSTEYAHALRTGLWPSTDVLPELETSQQGIRLSVSPLVI
ncbi:MAG: metallophosphoesterase family protein [Halopseudomonas sp.]